MENLDDEEDFHSSLEPMVIIDDEDTAANINLKDDSENDDINCDKDEVVKHIGPEVTIFPLIRKPRPSIKIKLFQKEYSPSKDDNNTKVQSVIRNHRTPVRLVSKDEAQNAEDTYAKRKSHPLEKCPICKKYFRRMKTHLLKHEFINRGPDDPLTCTICTKVFNNFSNLQIHMRTHTGDKPYICEVCHKSFSQSCNLVNHMRIHTGERPFKCPHCDRAFTQSGNLNNHIRLHTDEKPFKCHFCDKAFVQSGNLNSHIRNNHKFEIGFPSEISLSTQ